MSEVRVFGMVFSVVCDKNRIGHKIGSIQSLMCAINEKIYTCICSLTAVTKVLYECSFTEDLFRFLQLLCEGHNAGTSYMIVHML